MKGASEDNGWAICPEVIIVSDDENEIANSEGTGRRSFTEVVDKLLLLAKNPTLRNDNEVVSALIRELGITPTMKITCSLQATCEKLGYLLDFVNGHERRHRACEDLVMVLCEVLRLVQTAPYKLGNNNEICKTRDTLYDNSNPMDLAYGLMDRWGAWLLQCPRSSDDRSFAMGLVISRLETISMKFSDDINNFQNSVVMCEQQLKNTAEEWFETLKKCRHDLQFESLKPFEREWKVFDKTFCTTQAVQIKFEESKKARKTLIYHVQEKKLRCEFYRACLTLVYAVTQLAGIHAHEQHCAKDVNMVMNDMMVNMAPFCCALRDLIALSSQLNENVRQLNLTTDSALGRTTDEENQLVLYTFAKNFEAFWLIHRNWLPPRVLDLVTSCFNTLCGRQSEYNALERCPIRCAMSRVCVALGIGWQ